MNCPKCGVALTNIKKDEYRDKENPAFLHIHVFCNPHPDLGGCGYDEWYVRETPNSVIHLDQTVSKPRLGRVSANTAGSKECIPCTCGEDHEAIAYAYENYLKEGGQPWIEDCPDCGNHFPLVRNN